MRNRSEKEVVVNTALNAEKKVTTEEFQSIKKSIRRKWLLMTVVGTAAIAGTWWAWLAFFSSNTVTTENAYTAAEVADVTSLIAGPIAEVLAHDTQTVKAGDILVVLDGADAQLGVMKATADLARTERSVKQLFANDRVLKEKVGSWAAEVTAAAADFVRASANLKRAELDVSRQRSLAQVDATSDEKLTNAEAAFAIAGAMVNQTSARQNAAQANHAAAIEELKAHATLIDDVDVANHPDMLAARAKVEQAKLELSRTTIRAPIDGVISQRGVEIGQQVQPGQRLMTVAPVERVYVNANFKEAQLKNMQPGQLVRLTSDLYGGKTVYEGKVVGLAAGSGAAFSPIPAQNATGNWIKVVQRVPVRIALDEAQLRQYPLRVGLSMHVAVDLNSLQADNEHSGVGK
jgi:membrane fusion protein (multidrug efflux system)